MGGGRRRPGGGGALQVAVLRGERRRLVGRAAAAAAPPTGAGAGLRFAKLGGAEPALTRCRRAPCRPDPARAAQGYKVGGNTEFGANTIRWGADYLMKASVTNISANGAAMQPIVVAQVRACVCVCV